jgi:hypothetical protein
MEIKYVRSKWCNVMYILMQHENGDQKWSYLMDMTN